MPRIMLRNRTGSLKTKLQPRYQAPSHSRLVWREHGGCFALTSPPCWGPGCTERPAMCPAVPSLAHVPNSAGPAHSDPAVPWSWPGQPRTCALLPSLSRPPRPIRQLFVTMVGRPPWLSIVGISGPTRPHRAEASTPLRPQQPRAQPHLCIARATSLLLSDWGQGGQGQLGEHSVYR